ncbi:tyrosine-protein phosphatase [Desulfosporosinus sp. SB140]|uniref:tyrosine-protein phosphatase n=1 Tax=Desulfosporosinus paludis TaxID=3115649 RepID=UPI00388EC893
MIDIHCHILPGLDDGSKTLEETLGIVRQLQVAGLETLIATPHVIEGTDFLRAEEILTAVEQVRQAIAEAGIPVKIFPGAENYIFPDMAKWVRAGKLLTLANTGNYILVELPMLEIPHYVDQVFFELQVEGLTPVLAHPERYRELFHEPERLVEWANKGILFQLDLRSLSGRYGPQSKRLAETMLNSHLIHFLGSDAHRVSQNESVDREALQRVRQLLDEETFEEVAVKNPQRILEREIIMTNGDYELKIIENIKGKRRFWDLFRK